ncbi:hypothetical protein RFI_13115 [Reticulomyxa filosa]|uniref:SAM domain-containing protein n=1 Tax=Reticulomyxa filosa TaxID=46433 RepID=X6NE74_RETFI|nr:hypothetical protein RFI_13115 [Reticulomyxa filosa]|eukprot:ETO24044.1 hypothetical protein RFI_13115 [Reticulomyxa filosa]
MQVEDEYSTKSLKKWTYSDIINWTASLIEIGKKGMRQVIEMKGKELTGQMLADLTVSKLQDEYKLGKLSAMKIVEALDKIKKYNPPQTDEDQSSTSMAKNRKESNKEEEEKEEEEDGEEDEDEEEYDEEEDEEDSKKNDSNNFCDIACINKYQGLVGLKNLGNTCYMNSAVQVYVYKNKTKTKTKKKTEWDLR